MRKVQKTSKAINRKGGSRLGKTEVMQVRFDPRLRFSIELAAKSQNRSISSFLEWSAEKNLNDINISHYITPSFFTDKGQHPPSTLPMLITELWNIDEVIRFVHLSQAAPQLLSADEALVWEFICNEPLFWLPSSKLNKREPYIALIRAIWDEFQDLEDFDREKLIKQVGVLCDPAKIDKFEQLKKLWDELYPPVNDYYD